MPRLIMQFPNSIYNYTLFYVNYKEKAHTLERGGLNINKELVLKYFFCCRFYDTIFELLVIA